jgi:hypothetical protein
MATPSGFSSQKKDDRLKAEFTTIQPVGANRHALDVNVTMYNQLVNDGDLIDAVIIQDNGDIYSITVNTHGASKGDLVYFKTGALANRQLRIWEVPDANTIVFSETFSSGAAQPAPGDEIDILCPISPRTNAEGDLIVQPGPVTFLRDSVITTVEEDTGTPANNRPLPVKLASVTGDINITANDLNVSTSHLNDSMALGDGTVLFTAGLKSSANSFPVVLSTEQEAMIDGIEALLTTIDADTSSISTDASTIAGDTTSIDAKLPATLGQKTGAGSLAVVLASEQQALFPVNIGQKTSAGSLAVVLSTEQEAMIDGIEALLTTMDADTGVIAGDTTSIDGKLPSLGQANEAGSLSVALATEQDTLLTSLEGKDFATQTTLFALLTELQGKANLTETQPVSAVSLPLPTGAATETTLTTIDNVLDNIKIDTGNIDTSLNNIEAATALLDTVETGNEVIDLNGVTDSAWVQLIASTTADVKKAAIFMSSGKLVEFGVGAAASEVRKFVVPPGGLPGQQLEVSIPSGSRIAYKMVSGEATGVSGERLVINWMG